MPVYFFEFKCRSFIRWKKLEDKVSIELSNEQPFPQN